MTDVEETNLSPSNAIQIFDDIRNEYVWNVERISDAILSMYFGPPQLVVRQPRPDSIRPGTPPDVAQIYRRRHAVPEGPWRLFVEDGLWHVQAFGAYCSRIDPDLTNMQKCLALLSGQMLSTVTWEPHDKAWRFEFDLGGILTITADPVVDKSSGDEWVFYRQSAPTLACLRDDRLILEASLGAEITKSRNSQF